MKQLRTVKYIDGRLVMRPGTATNAAQWADLRRKFLESQVEPDGKAHCGTCWLTDAPLELHHRHYDNFGNEHPSDLILLCRFCHEAITSRIRNARRAMGDQTLDDEFIEAPPPASTFRPTSIKVTVEIEGEVKPVRPAFRPTSKLT